MECGKDDFRTQPGPQVQNRIAATPREQFARVFQVREPRALDDPTEARIVFLIHRELEDFTRQLPELVEIILTNREANRKGDRCA